MVRRTLSTLLFALVACGGHDDFCNELTSPDVVTRERAAMRPDDDEARAHVPLLMYVARYDPEYGVRHFAYMRLGATDDPRALEFLESSLGTTNAPLAIEGLRTVRSAEGCEILASAWVKGPNADPYVETLLHDVIDMCGEALVPYRAEYPDRVEPILAAIPKTRRTWER